MKAILMFVYLYNVDYCTYKALLGKLSRNDGLT